MASATQRSEVACQKIGFNPVEHDSCCGSSDDGVACEKRVDSHIRQIAYYMIGHGAHLSAQSDELCGILTEAADLLACCKAHIRSDKLVKLWLINWQKSGASVDGKKDDAPLRTLTRDRRTVERIPQAALKEGDGDVRNKSVALVNKPEKDTQTIRDGHNRHHERTYSAPPRSLGNLSKPQAAHFANPTKRERGVPATHSPLLPTLPEEPETCLPDVACLDRVGRETKTPALSESASSLSPEEALPTRHESPSLQEQKRPVIIRIETAPVVMSTTEPLVKRRSTFSTVSNALLKAVTQPFGSSTTPSAQTEQIYSPMKMTPRSEPSPFSRSTEIATRAVMISDSTTNRTERSMRPALTLRTTFPAAPMTPSASPATPTPVVAPAVIDPAASAEPTVSGFQTVKERRPRLFKKPKEVCLIECKICVFDLDVNDAKTTWTCPQCRGQVHRDCFEQWNMHNIMMFRSSTPCPFCRFDRITIRDRVP